MLIHATGGGTTQWAAQMAKICGYKVIGTVARGKADVALATGADETIIVEDTPGASFEDYTTCVQPTCPRLLRAVRMPCPLHHAVAGGRLPRCFFLACACAQWGGGVRLWRWG